MTFTATYCAKVSLNMLTNEGDGDNFMGLTLSKLQGFESQFLRKSRKTAVSSKLHWQAGVI